MLIKQPAMIRTIVSLLGNRVYGADWDAQKGTGYWKLSLLPQFRSVSKPEEVEVRLQRHQGGVLQQSTVSALSLSTNVHGVTKVVLCLTGSNYYESTLWQELDLRGKIPEEFIPPVPAVTPPARTRPVPTARGRRRTSALG